MSIESDVEMEKEINNEVNINYNLFKDLLEINEERRHKGEWFNIKYLLKVGYLFASYQDYLQTIKRSLKISKSSYYRLLHKPISQNSISANRRRSKREHKHLNGAEEVFIIRLVNPPTFPNTLNEI